MVQSFDDFQKVVDSMLIQHQSILDIISKGQEASARVNRSVTKSVTSCGCLTVDAQKNEIPEDATLSDLKYIFHSHLKGTLCPTCRDIIQSELGKQLFYIAALANTLGLSIDDILKREEENLKTLTVYNLR
ncbi:MAG: hypothetical protein APF84_10755 [Gracilibacter sp. BRH_c7a]|nr:MAG: hypothetical protein APF84_10755 [Gracilibacter sp. BRH_c7a]